MPFINSNNASELGRRSGEARRQRAEQLRKPFVPTIVQQDDYVAQALVRVRKQIRQVDDQIDGCNDAREWDCLTRAKERLFKQWTHLAGIPGPGNFKPRAQPPRMAQRLPEPTLAED